LYAGGFFTHAGAVETGYIACWDGESWSAVGGGMTGEPGLLAGVFSFGVWDGDLIAGGSFLYSGDTLTRNVARWDGGTWSAMDWGTNGIVSAIAAWSGALYIGGAFSRAGGPTANRIAVWNGEEWGPVGQGVSGGDLAVVALTPYDRRLVAGGAFLEAGGSPARFIAAWDGERWESLGAGTNGIVRSLRAHRGGLLVGGDFVLAGESPSRYIARWDAIPAETPLGFGLRPSGTGRLGAAGLADPVGMGLAAVTANPFRSRILLSAISPPGSAGDIAVFDARGRRLAGLGSVPPSGVAWGVAWDGRDDSGRLVPPGLYFARLTTGAGTRSARLIRIE
jgi:hypothetical protein